MKFSSKKLGKALASLVVQEKTSSEDLVKEVAAFLVSLGKTSKLGDVTRSFSKEYNKQTGTIDIKVVAASKEVIPSFVSFKDAKISVTEKIDASLLGGVKLLIDDLEIDTSIKTKINTLKTIAH